MYMTYSFSVAACLSVVVGFSSCNLGDGYYYLDIPACEVIPGNFGVGTVAVVKGDTVEFALLGLENRPYDRTTFDYTFKDFSFKNKKGQIEVDYPRNGELSARLQHLIAIEHFTFKRGDTYRPDRFNGSFSGRVIVTTVADRPIYIRFPRMKRNLIDAPGKFMAGPTDTARVKFWERTNMETRRAFDRIYLKKARDTTFIFYQAGPETVELYLKTGEKLPRCEQLTYSLID